MIRYCIASKNSKRICALKKQFVIMICIDIWQNKKKLFNWSEHKYTYFI